MKVLNSSPLKTLRTVNHISMTTNHMLENMQTHEQSKIEIRANFDQNLATKFTQSLIHHKNVTKY